MDQIEKRSKELIQELHEIEQSLISDERLKSTMIASGNQLRKVFGDDGYYGKYLQSFKALGIKEEDNILQNMINIDDKTNITTTKAITNGETIRVIKNSILSRYLVQNNIIPKNDIKDIQDMFKDESSVLHKPLESKIFDEDKLDALERYVHYLSDHMDYLQQHIHDIIDNFENPYSLTSILSHELAHHIFKKFTKLQGKTYVELNESYSFAIQKALSLFNKKNISQEDVQKEISGLYKIMPAMKEIYGDKKYMFMKAFIPLLGGFTIANAIGLAENDTTNQILFNKSYDQKSYTGLFTGYDKAIENIKDIDIKKTLQQVKITSLHQLKKCREELQKDAINSIDNYYMDDNMAVWAKMFIRTLELLSYTGEEKTTILKLQKEYFMKFIDEVAIKIGHDEGKASILEDMYIMIKSSEFKPEEMMDLIDKT